MIDISNGLVEASKNLRTGMVDISKKDDIKILQHALCVSNPGEDWDHLLACTDKRAKKSLKNR
jgi:hypothetical protein